MPTKGIKISENPRCVDFQCRMTKEEALLLTNTAKKLGKSKTAVLMMGLKIVSSQIVREE